VSLVFLAFGIKNFFALFVTHAILAALTCLLLYLSVAKFSRITGTIAGLGFALYPPFVYHSVAVAESTTLLLFLISLFFYDLMSLYKGFSGRKWLLTSMVGGLMALTEPATVPFIFLSLLYLAYVTLNTVQQISLELAIAVLVFGAAVAPWTIRNYVTFKELVFIKSCFGSNLKESMYRSGVRLPAATELSLERAVQGMDEVSEDKAVAKAFTSWIRENPMVYLKLLPKNFINFWWETDRYRDNQSTSYVLGRRVPYILLLLLGLPGMLWRLVQISKTGERRNAAAVYDYLILILIATYTGIYTVMGAWNLRYHFPVEFGMLVFCAETAVYVIDKLRVPSSSVVGWLEAGR
jgi:4-amino-4-deoxy-L-arabinose transferase-like glycosyltransferase